MGSSGSGFFPALCQDVRGLAVIGGALIFKKDTEYVPAAFGYCSVIIGLALVSLAVLVWEQGLKRYEGAG